MGTIHEARDEMLHDVPDTEEALRRGEYTVIRSLIRVLEVSMHGISRVLHELISMNLLHGFFLYLCFNSYLIK